MRHALAILIASTTPAAAEPAQRPWHGRVAAGGGLLASGHDGDHVRFDLSLDVEPRSRYGVLLAWRAFDRERRGAILAGLVFEAAAARPRLVLGLHADLGVELDQRAPVIGAGVRTTLSIIGPLALVLDSGPLLVIDGVERSRLILHLGTALGARW